MQQFLRPFRLGGHAPGEVQPSRQTQEQSCIPIGQSHLSAPSASCGPRGSVTKVETERVRRVQLVAGQKLVQVRVASLSLSIQRSDLEDDLTIFLLFYESLYYARLHREGSKGESCLLPGELALSKSRYVAEHVKNRRAFFVAFFLSRKSSQTSFAKTRRKTSPDHLQAAWGPLGGAS